MARRRTRFRQRIIDLALFADYVLRVAGAIALDALAFIVWNVGTRPPLDVLRDVRRGVRDARTLLAGSISALVGFIFIVAGIVLLLPAIADKPRDLAVSELFTLLVALAIEYLVGDDVRRLTGTRSPQ